MTRYQLVYSKRKSGGTPITCWKDTKEEALALAEILRNHGYSVDIWAWGEKSGWPFTLSDPTLNKAIEAESANYGS